MKDTKGYPRVSLMLFFYSYGSRESYLSPGLGSSTVDQVLKYTKYPKYIPSTSTGQVLIFFKKYLSTSSTFISSTSTSTSTHIKICSKVRMDIGLQSRINFGWTK